MPWVGKKLTGFTLVELLISIAISGILMAIIFTSMRNDRQRNAVKNAAEQITTEIQARQNYAQNGVVFNKTLCRGGTNDGKPCTVVADCPGGGTCVTRPPHGYGFYFATGTTYMAFADGPFLADELYNGGAEIQALQTLKNQVEIASITFPDINCDLLGRCGTAILVYQVPNGALSIVDGTADRGEGCLTANPGSGCRTGVIITLKQTTLKICYNITVTASSGTVSKRQLTSCP